jgi:hypothetical protein
MFIRPRVSTGSVSDLVSMPKRLEMKERPGRYRSRY